MASQIKTAARSCRKQCVIEHRGVVEKRYGSVVHLSLSHVTECRRGLFLNEEPSQPATIETADTGDSRLSQCINEGS